LRNKPVPSTSDVVQQNLERITRVCSEAKGKDISVMDVSKTFTLSRYFVIASARSDRQVQGISNRILNELRDVGVKPLAFEGVQEGHWALLDYGEIVVHIFFEKIREMYDLEGLWTRAIRIGVREDGSIEWPRLAA
jgi:ribosome-associated protein